MAIVPPEGLETHQTVAIPRNLAIVATNYSERGSQRRVRWIVSKIQSLATSKDQLLIFIALIGNWQGMVKGQLVLERNISQPAGHLSVA
ncbi:hypothetical protein NHJ13051_003772 [Beauveria bassiana]